MRKFLKPISALIIYLMMQLILTLFLLIYFIFTKGPDVQYETIVESASTQIILLLSIVFSIAIISLLGLIRWREVFSWGAMHNHTILTTILASILGVIAISIGSDYMELEEPNFSALQNTIGGLLHMTVIGPLGEELCCREALLGGMLRRGVKPWIAILLSAFLFGAMHLNMSQFFGASLFGIMLAIIYYKTGNIILTSFLHILNNTVSVILNNIYGQGTTTVSLLGGDAVAIPIALISLATCIFFFWNYWKQAPHPSDTAS